MYRIYDLLTITNDGTPLCEEFYQNPDACINGSPRLGHRLCSTTFVALPLVKKNPQNYFLPIELKANKIYLLRFVSAQKIGPFLFDEIKFYEKDYVTSLMTQRFNKYLLHLLLSAGTLLVILFLCLF